MVRIGGIMAIIIGWGLETLFVGIVLCIGVNAFFDAIAKGGKNGRSME
jgi:hypothetical protein